MHAQDDERHKADRAHLFGVAYRMLGSRVEADDAVQEAFLRAERAGEEGIENPLAWRTTIVARVCLDMLRSRKLRREEPLDAAHERPASADPENELALANSVGLALLVVLELLPPPERIAFVLHDLFDLPFEEIAAVVDRTPEAARQLASRGRRRVRGAPEARSADVLRQREVVDAFLAASRRGDFDALMGLLDPDVVQRSDATGTPTETRGAAILAKRAIGYGARAAAPALIDGVVGAVIAPMGRLSLVVLYTVENGRITAMDAIADRARIAAMEITLLPDEVRTSG